MEYVLSHVGRTVMQLLLAVFGACRQRIRGVGPVSDD